MNKLVLITAAIMLLAASAFSAEYRNFTNQEGKTIVARVTDYDAEGDRVQLELKNRKKAWVELSTLSEEDQAYTKQWKQEKSKGASSAGNFPATSQAKATAGKEELSRQEVRDIGKLYEKAVQKKDYELWHSLFVDLYKGDERLNQKYFMRLTRQWSSIHFSGTDGHNAQINIIASNGGEGERWLLLQPDGAIKYDFLMFLHPFEEAAEWLARLKRCNDDNGGSARNVVMRSGKQTLADANYFMKRLAELGVPCFGYDANASEREQKKCLKQIANWLIDLDEDWDISEPKLTLPKGRYDSVIQGLKSAYR